MLVRVPLEHEVADQDVGVRRIRVGRRHAFRVRVDPHVRPHVPLGVSPHVANGERDVSEPLIGRSVRIPGLLPEVGQPLERLRLVLLHAAVGGLGRGHDVVFGTGIRVNRPLPEDRIRVRVGTDCAGAVRLRMRTQGCDDRGIRRHGDGGTVRGDDRDLTVVDRVLKRRLDAEHVGRRLPCRRRRRRDRNEPSGDHRNGKDEEHRHIPSTRHPQLPRSRPAPRRAICTHTRNGT